MILNSFYFILTLTLSLKGEGNRDYLRGAAPLLALPACCRVILRE